MKHRTEEEGRSLVASFVGSGMTSRAFAQTSGIKECTLQYWKHRVKDLSAGDVPSRFVEVSKRASGCGAAGVLTVTLCDVQVSFSTFPSAAWFGELLHSLRPQ
jgi:hypothetical protein